MFSLRPLLLRSPRQAATTTIRQLHHSLPAPRTPSATTAVPDVATFLTAIGRKCSSHAAKFGSWPELFDATSAQLKQLGVEPARTRRYIIRWREKFRMTEGTVVLKEQKRGQKIDGGERRRKQIRAKRFAEERKAAAEKTAAEEKGAAVD